MNFRITLRIFLIAIALLCDYTLDADTGDLDPTFDGDGKVTTDFAGSFDEINGAVLQSDGKIVVVGATVNGGNFDFAIARYNSNGSLDTSFDLDGKASLDFAGDLDQALDVAIQSNGRIVVAGSADIANHNIALVRYLSDGSLDVTFDDDGKVTTEFGTNGALADSIAIQSNGKIVIAGHTVSTTADFVVARYNTDGSLDTTFGFDGIVTTDFGNRDEGNELVIQPDGKIVVAGRTAAAGFSDFALARFNPDGSPDTTFDSDGKLTTDFASTIDSASALVIQADGKLIAGGQSTTPPGNINTDFAMARYNTNGTLDLTFDSDGKVLTDFAGSFDSISALAIHTDGKIIAAGRSTVSSNNDDFAISRHNTDGSLDTNFNFDGKVTTDFVQSDNCKAVLIQPNGKIVAAGAILNPSDFALARYEANPTPPATFSDDYEDGVLASDWTYVKPNWIETAGNLTGIPTAKPAEVIATPAFGGCSVCNMEASMQTAGGAGNKLWFLTWFVDKKNTVEVLMKEETNKWILRQRVNGAIVAKTKGAATILPNVFYNVRVTFDGVNFELFVDGISLATLPAFAAPNGTVGFRVKKTTGKFGFVLVD
jgi:uncharacterized delta-60 repeat protein